MRQPLAPTMIALSVVMVLAGTAAEARVRQGRHPAVAVSDSDRTLMRMAERDSLQGRPAWEENRPLASYLPPFTRERVAAPPFTGWGYGGTIPGAWPGF